MKVCPELPLSRLITFDDRVCRSDRRERGLRLNEQRSLIISRTYEKGSIVLMLFVAQVSGEEFSGEVFQYEIWRNNREEVENRVTSGNKYEIRRIFINKLLDLHEDGWTNRNAATYGNPGFFDPGEL